MKSSKIALIVLFAMVTCVSFAQDVIQTFEGEIEAKIVSREALKTTYKLYDYQDGPVFSISNHQIRQITYENGMVEVIAAYNPRSNRCLGISGGLNLIQDNGVFGIATVRAGYFIVPQVELVTYVNFWDEVDLTFGGLYHINKTSSTNNLTVYSGLQLATGNSYGFGVENPYFQIPLGLGLLFNSGFAINAEFSAPISSQVETQNHVTVVLGYRFKKKQPK